MSSSGFALVDNNLINEADEYIRKHRLVELFEDLASAVAYRQPEKLNEFLIQRLELKKEQGLKSGIFTEEIAQELVSRAILFNQEQEKRNKEEIKELNIDSGMLTLDGMNDNIAILLGRNGIKTIKDVADLSTDEFIEYCGEEYSKNANQAIMDARRIAYGIEI